jgi:SAM-dependent methyltransferase
VSSTTVGEAPAVVADPAAVVVCPSCRGDRVTPFYEQRDVPVHSCRLLPSREEALAFPRGSIRLAFCEACGFIFNVLFDPTGQDYSVAYEETQGFSPKFRAFARELAARWIERYDLRGKTIVEIGCGKGEFLALMCELGDNAGIGIDPSFLEERVDPSVGRGITILRELYAERHTRLAADALVSRHTLEHIQPVSEFLRLVRAAAHEPREAVVLFDLPDVVRVLREAAFWDVYYEHASYFSPGSLGRLFRRHGFDVIALERDYDDQYLVIEARAASETASRPGPLEETPAELAREVEAFAANVRRTASRWKAFLADARAAGKRVAVWGAGSKAVAFLTTLATDAEVAYAVDVNPHKQGMYMPGTGHAIVGPDHVPSERPDVVVAMNPVYVDEIRAMLASLGVDAEVVHA